MAEPERVSPTDDLGMLIERARAGEANAREELLERCREPLLVRIRWMMGDEARRVAESADFLQSTFAAALTALPRFEHRGGDALLRWMTAIARNKIRGALRRRREEALSALSSAVGGSGEELTVDTALTLFDAFARLSAEDRRLIELRDMEGRSFVEIGNLLGCSDRHAHRLHGHAVIRLSRPFRDREP